MEIYYAPLEGITGYIYRNAHHDFFGGVDKYFIPFLSPNQNRALSPKEIRDVLPEHNKNMYVVPQILTNHAEHFIRAAKELQEKYGYSEMNLNLGCPSKTVVTKGKGAGFLAKKDELDKFLQEIFLETEKTDIKISVKTRIGMESAEEFHELLEIFNRYPLHELIVHPRVQQDYYNNTPDWKAFGEAVRESRNPLCYNGDIFTLAHYREWKREFPGVDRIMLGRGLLMDPALAEEIRAEAVFEKEALPEEVLRAFHDRLYEDYRRELSGDTNVLFKMKEVWFYMIHLFSDNEKYWKKIKKVSRLCDYEEVVRRLFIEQKIEKITSLCKKVQS